jgi:hypothetical protein
MSDVFKDIVGGLLIAVGSLTTVYGGQFLIKVGATLLINGPCDALLPPEEQR